MSTIRGWESSVLGREAGGGKKKKRRRRRRIA